MKIGLLSILFLFFLSCKEKTKSNSSAFVQQHEINVVQPKIFTTNTIIDDEITITARLEFKGVAIHYTSDGTEPSQKSTKYTAPFIVKKEGIYSFKAYHSDWKPSATTSLKLYKKGIIPSKIDWQTDAHSTYPGVGTNTIINQKKGSLNFRDEQWVGYDSIVIAAASFDEKLFIKSMTIGYLIDTKSWIFPPEKVVILLNQKDSIHIDIPKITEGNTRKIDDVQIPIYKKIKNIEIKVYNTPKLPKWHPGNGNKAWLFMDEWIFNE